MTYALDLYPQDSSSLNTSRKRPPFNADYFQVVFTDIAFVGVGSRLPAPGLVIV